LRHAREFSASGTPWIFDPGQALPMFSGDELQSLLGQAHALTVNDYESKLLSEKTGLSETDIAQRVTAQVVTMGGDGCLIRQGGKTERVAAAKITRAADPTGCGDAFRGGLLYALSRNLGWQTAVRLGSVMGAIKIEHDGPQNHPVTRDEVARRYQANYGAAPW